MTGALQALLCVGAGQAAVSLSDQTLEAFNAFSATSQYQLLNNGTVNGNGATLENWLDNGVASDFECRATVTSGSLSSGTTGTWLALSSGRGWAVTKSLPAGSKTATMTVEIRNAVTLDVLASATIVLSATVGEA